MAFHYVARGVIRDGNHILLVRAIGDNMTFLPGGHIEFGGTYGEMAEWLKAPVLKTGIRL